MEFDWDEGNRGKNLRHGVHDWEIEDAFQDRRRASRGRILVDHEERFVLLARCHTSGKYLSIVYTFRIRAGESLIRPISAREMSEAERRRYLRRR